MKKEYSSPKARVVEITLEQVIAGSNLSGMQSESLFSVDLSEDEYNGEAASRLGYDCWEDDL